MASTNREATNKTVAGKIQPVGGSTHLKMVVYGKNKTGKTVFACSSGLKTLLIDCNEKGTDSVRNLGSHIQWYPMAKFPEIDDIFWYLKTAQHDFEVVVIDTMTMLATLGMRHVLREDIDKALDRDPMTPDQRSWGKLGELLKETIIRYRNLPMHVIFTAQEKQTTTDDDDGGTVIAVHPELSPAPRSTLLSAVSIIGRIYVKEVEVNEKTKMQRRMLLGAHPKYVAGNRFPELRYVEVNPDLSKFIEKINGGKNAAGEQPS